MKIPRKHTIILILGSAFAVLFGAACSTVRGFGQDVENTGENIKRSVR